MNDIDVAKAVQDIAAWLGISLSPAAAGLIGAMFSLRWLAQMAATQVWMTLIMGSVVAGYLAPAIAKAVSLPEGGVGLVVGFVAMGFIGGLMNMATQWSADPWATIRKIFSRGGDQK